MKKISLALVLLLTGCAASTKNIGSLVLPTSNKTIDVVQHRSDSEECAVAIVLQTYNAAGDLIDSKVSEGNAFHCQLTNGVVNAAGLIGAARVLRPATTAVNTAVDGVSSALSEGSSANASTSSYSGSESASSASSSSGAVSNATGGQGGVGGTGGNGGNGGQGGQGASGTKVKKVEKPKHANPGGHGNDGGYDNPGKHKR